MIPQILADLLSEKINILLVEGGAQTLRSFIEKGLWDEARVIKSQTLLRDAEQPETDYVSAPTLPIKYLENRQQLADNEVFTYKKP